MRVIAFYLPQYHPIPENDAWWGAGFTEWTNVRKARPLFPGHYQPHEPADLGYYDLRDPGARQAQADLARAYGIKGFCYYHYWFNGKRLLSQPFDAVLESGKPGFPFCLCWANENWTRAWDGQLNEILIAQKYSDDDDRAHMHWLARAFRDERYIRVDGKPVFLVYQASALPAPLRTALLWRDEARRLGVGEIFLVKVESIRDERAHPSAIGFDAAVEFQPDTRRLLTRAEKIYWRLAKYFNFRQGMLAIDYADWIRRACAQRPRAYAYFPSVTPSWDNSPRRANGAFILKNSSPALYEEWLRSTLMRERDLVFINAWNEWGESNHLEPCRTWGRGYLEATRRAIGEA